MPKVFFIKAFFKIFIYFWVCRVLVDSVVWLAGITGPRHVRS